MGTNLVAKSLINFKEIYDQDIGATITSIQDQDNYIEIHQVDDTFLEALISIEDKRFYSHQGFDPLAIGRSVMLNTFHGEIVSGASTITQQVAKNIFLTFDQTYERKLTEVILAIYLEEHYSKEEIIELYINIIYYGEGQHGIYQAANHYFNKAPHDLNAHESVLLACIPQWPSRYALTDHYQLAAERSEVILQAMMEASYIDTKERLAISQAIQEGVKYVDIEGQGFDQILWK